MQGKNAKVSGFVHRMMPRWFASRMMAIKLAHPSPSLLPFPLLPIPPHPSHPSPSFSPSLFLIQYLFYSPLAHFPLVFFESRHYMSSLSAPPRRWRQRKNLKPAATQSLRTAHIISAFNNSSP